MPIYASPMTTARARRRCRERIELISGSSLDSDSVRREVIGELKLAIGFERYCVPLADPQTEVMYAGVAETDHIQELPRLLFHDADRDEPNSGAALGCARSRVGRLSAETQGDLARSRRWSESLERFGTGDELRVIAGDQRGIWGRFDLWRDRDDRPFDSDDERLLRDVSSDLGQALRRTAVVPRDTVPGPPLDAGVLLVSDDLRPLGGTPPVWRWFDALNPAHIPYPDGVPSLVWATIGRLAAIERGEAHAPARIRIRTADGNWAVIEASRISGSLGAFAVTIHPAGVREVLGIVCRANGLTARERELVELITEGLTTSEIATRLFISHYTVQDHIKSIFAKVGVNSRLQLLTGVLAQSS
jgi:DNA-binding CsgD family transcriptional regulator